MFVSGPRRSCGTCGTTFGEATEYCALDGAALGPPGDDRLIGEVFDRYRIIEALGDGGMARVYRARHQFLEDEVAIKILFGELAADRRFRARFLREAQTARKIRHPHVVEVMDFGETEHGLVFMVMELVHGRALGDYLADDPTPPLDWVATITEQIAHGLAAAHDSGVVHRDLKPHNVMITRGPTPHAKLLDFGIARIEYDEEGATRLTKTGHILGTPSYMSPEQISAGEIDHRSDLYSLGVLLYEMISGTTPFLGERIDVLSKHLSDTPPTPPAANGLGDLAMRLMAKKPDDRPASAKAVAGEIARIEAPADAAEVRPLVEPRPTDPPNYAEITGIEPFDEGDSGNRTLLIALVLAAFLVVALIASLNPGTPAVDHSSEVVQRPDPQPPIPPLKPAKTAKPKRATPTRRPKATVKAPEPKVTPPPANRMGPPEPPPAEPEVKPPPADRAEPPKPPATPDGVGPPEPGLPEDLDEAIDRLFEGPPRPPHLVTDKAKLRRRMSELAIGTIVPGQTEAHKMLASAQSAVAEQNLEGAEAMLRLCLAEAARPAGCHSLLAAILESLGRPTEALVQYRAYLSAGPSAKDARRVKEIANALRAVVGEP